MTVYWPLSTSPEGLLSEENSDVRTAKRWFTAEVCLIVCVACTIVNAILAFRLEMGHHIYPAPPPPTYQNIHLLRRPSQFIRFDEIKRPSPPVPKQFNNYPTLMTQVDSAFPDKVFEDDVRRYMAPIGTISPKDRRFLVTDTISTIVQFRAIDYGMERCELHLELPPLRSTSPAGGSVSLSIRRLNTTIPFDVNTLSANTLSPHASKVADVSLSQDKDDTWHRSFSCSTEEVLSFEVSCSPSTTPRDGCHVEWWQNAKKPNPGLYIIQHSTV